MGADKLKPHIRLLGSVRGWQCVYHLHAVQRGVATKVAIFMAGGQSPEEAYQKCMQCVQDRQGPSKP